MTQAGVALLPARCAFLPAWGAELSLPFILLGKESSAKETFIIGLAIYFLLIQHTEQHLYFCLVTSSFQS